MLVCLLAGVTTAAAGMEDARLKEWLSGNFIAPESMRWEEIDEFKKGFSVTDEQLYRILMEVYADAQDKWATLTPKTPEWSRNSRTIEGVLGWLPKCGDIPVKEFLLSYAKTKENDSRLRESAILSYLREADAEEAKNALLRFLVEQERVDSQTRSSICRYAWTTFQNASAEKKAAILEALYVSLAREDNKWLFRVYDDILCKVGNEYANSHQRLAILKRLINAPSLCKADDYAMPELQEKLKVLQKMSLYTNINTNLTTLKGRDFNLPLPVAATNEINETAPESTEPKEGVEKNKAKTANPIGVLSLIGGAAVLVLGFGLLHLSRKR